VYLKRLELHGFKSFADKTVLEFQPGVTLVVGPNGSGKSNITDAIRWVLGEQSAKSLRGGKMEDVIFAGSEKRKSLGMAEVSLTIDNSSGTFPLDFNEITVTRRLYRSGESDYLINKVPCRLKDVHELFMDTGVGREGFSMIGQGRVEEILMARPEERRAILEDAAGIIKYRYRKKEAAKKLDETQQHLLRIEDLLLELRSQEGPLAQQAKEARQYQMIKKELDQLEMGMITGEIRIAREKLLQLQTELEQVQQELLSQKTGFVSVRSQEEGIRLEMDRLSEQLGRLQALIYEQSLQAEKMDSENRSDEEKSASLEAQATGLEQEKENLQAEWNDLSGQWKARQNEGADLALKLNHDREILEAEEKNEKEIADTVLQDRQALAAGEEAHFDLLRQESFVQNEIVRCSQDLLAMNRQQERLDESRQAAAEAAEKAREKQLALEQQQSGLESRISEEMARLAEQESLRQQDKTAYEQAQQANRLLAGERGQALSKYKLFEEMEKEGQGYAQGVREILRRRDKDWIDGILGTVAQNLRVDKEYEVAVEVALGGAAQNVITETEKNAQAAISWLKNYNKGRVTFLPLDTIKPKSGAMTDAPKGKGILGRMVDLVDFEDRFLPVMEFLLGRVWVVDDLSHAVARAKEIGFRYRLVTLDGQVVNAGGSLTGGSVRVNADGFISRRRQLAELDQEIRRLSQRILQGEGEEEVLLQKLNQQKEALVQSQDQLQQWKQELAGIASSLRHQEEAIQRCVKELQTMDWQQEETDEARVRLTGSLNEHSQRKEAIIQALAESSGRIDGLKQRIQTADTQRMARQQNLTELRIQVAASTERLNSFDHEGSFLKDRMDQLQRMMASQHENAVLCRQKARQHFGALQSRKREAEALLAEIVRLEEEKAFCQEKRQGLQQKVMDLDENQRKISAEIQSREDRLRQMQIQESRFQANLEEWGQRLSEQFGLSWEEALDTIEPVQERRKAQLRIKELREEIGAMKQVNLGAVEEYDRLVERLTFLTNQTEDLVKAKADLEQVIQKMDALVASKFKETFEQINERFNLVFQRLFDGGRASLYLTLPDNMLETGVDIMAQPPGKKPQHLSLLSGGEKALTAISLLLAMLQVRPSPFSILDEIESNLDDANVDRFAALIKEYSHAGSQFIVITHRRGTMEVGDVIYGVAAEEVSGVSRILSVRMQDLEHVI